MMAPGTRGSRGINWPLLLLLLLLLAALSSLRVLLGGFFLSDDFDLLLGIASRGPLGLWTFAEGGGFFRPLTSLSLALDHLLWGRNPTGYLMTGALLHGGNAFLVALTTHLLTRRLAVRAHQRYLTYGAGITFVLLPCHVEPVAWLAGRADLLATLFCLLSLVLQLRRRDGPRPGDLALSLLTFAAALLCKESVVALPLIVFVLQLGGGPVRHRLRVAIFRALPYAGLLLAYGVVRHAFLGTLVGGYGETVHLAGWGRVLLNLLLFPARAVFPPMALPWLALCLAGAVGAALLCSALGGGRDAAEQPTEPGRRPPLRAALILAACFVLAALPVLNLRLELHTSEGERFLYWPSAFAAVLLPLLLDRVCRRARPLALCSALVALYLAAGFQLSVDRWVQAGAICRTVVQRLTTLPQGGRVVLLNVPESLEGAFILRNGLQAAVELFGAGEGDHPELCPLTYHTLGSVDDQISATRRGRLVSVVLHNPASRFFDANAAVRAFGAGRDPARFRHFRATAIRRRRFDLLLHSTRPDDRFFIFTGGRLTPLLPGPAKRPRR